MGKILVRRRQYDEASDAFQKALNIDNSSPLAIANQIDLYKIRNSDNKDADTLFNKYIEQFNKIGYNVFKIISKFIIYEFANLPSPP